MLVVLLCLVSFMLSALYPECHYAECHYAESRGAVKNSYLLNPRFLPDVIKFCDQNELTWMNSSETFQLKGSI
jgi:hypothetical protein